MPRAADDPSGTARAAQSGGALPALPVAMFFASFAWSFVFVSLPFHIQQISTVDPVATLRWTGWILGISSLVTVLTGPFWGRFGERRNARTCYVLVEILQGLGFLGMAIARTLAELFAARLVLGAMGATSTFAFILAGRSADPGEVRRRVAAIQSAMTVGQVMGPLAGAIAAARFGFRASFVLGGLILVGCAAMVQWLVALPADSGVVRTDRRGVRTRDVVSATLIVLGGSTQVFFLTSILPRIVPELGVPAADTLESGGILIFVSGVAAALGAVMAPRLAELGPERRVIAALLLASSGFLAALSAVTTLWGYAAIRFCQVLCIAPVFPLVVSRIAQRAGGETIGIVNSARIGAAFIGPVIATSMLAWTSPVALYLLLAVIGLAGLPFVLLRDSASPAARP